MYAQVERYLARLRAKPYREGATMGDAVRELLADALERVDSARETPSGLPSPDKVREIRTPRLGEALLDANGRKQF